MSKTQFNKFLFKKVEQVFLIEELNLKKCLL